jgi:hypothetical protein
MNFPRVKKIRIKTDVVGIIRNDTSHHFISALYKGLLALMIVFAVIFILFKYILYLC